MKNYKLANLRTGEVLSFKANDDVQAEFRSEIEIELRGWDIQSCACREVVGFEQFNTLTEVGDAE